MASIIKVGEKWRALVRRKGHPSYCKTFKVKAQADAWARQIEADIDRGTSPKAAAVIGKALLVGDLIDAYTRLRSKSRPVLDTSTEHYDLKRLKKHLGTRDAAHLTPDLKTSASTRLSLWLQNSTSRSVSPLRHCKSSPTWA